MDVALSSLYNNAAEFSGFPASSEPIWLLGIKYNINKDRSRFEDDIRSRILFTYRKSFDAIGSSGLTSDVGWGCMLRCGQMMLAQALINRHLTRDWRWKPGKYDPKYFEILRLFRDQKDCCYSIHKIACMGMLEGKAIGDWFGPNTVLQVLRKLVGYDRWSGLVVHVAMDNTILVDQVRELCSQREDPAQQNYVKAYNVPSVILSAYLSTQQQMSRPPPVVGSELRCSVPSSNSVLAFNETRTDSERTVPSFTGVKTSREETAAKLIETASRADKTPAKPDKPHWSPLLLVVPLRLGLSKITPVYYSAIKTCFTFKQTVGIIGGKPCHAHWFIGCTESKLLYLDPHICQPYSDVGRDGLDKSYHSDVTACMDISELDPSIAVGFYCESEEDFENLCRNLRRSFVSGGTKTPLFELFEGLPPSCSSTAVSTNESLVSSGQPSNDPRLEDEYEII